MDKPTQILLRGRYNQIFKKLIAHYEKEVPTVFTKADIVRIAIVKLAKQHKLIR